MAEKFEFKKGSIPEGGVAHMIPDYGRIVITEDMTDEIIEILPENICDLYFKKKAQTEELN